MKTTIDWLKFRSKWNPFDLLEVIRPAFGTAAEMLEIRTGAKGRDGWKFGADLMMVDEPIAHFDYGGDSQRGWVRFDMPGKGCGWVQDWRVFETLGDLHDFKVLESKFQRSIVPPEFEIQRVDIALTSDNPQLVSDAIVVKAHAEGKFCNGGRPPHMKTIMSTDAFAGKTRYIGSRKSFKYLRCYEKGWEQLKDLPHEAKSLITRDVKVPIDGLGMVRAEDCYRVELELKNVDKFIPWETIGRRDDVFAGAYPFCAELLPGQPEFHMNSLPDFKPRATLLKSLSNCSKSYGAILKAAHLAFGGDDAAMMKVIQAVIAAEPSPRLVEDGVLTVEHVPGF